MLFALTYQPHGGSSLSLTMSEVLDLDVGHRDWMLERLTAQRRREADAISRANRR